VWCGGVNEGCDSTEIGPNRWVCVDGTDMDETIKQRISVESRSKCQGVDVDIGFC